jgi:hydrocephalus-inducing protein
MTAEKTEHKGSMFVALSDGSAISYQLIGHALPPLTSGHIVKQITCKATHTEILSVKNWLPEPQKFKVTIETDHINDPSLEVKGLDFIDIPALGERQYRLVFWACKEGLTVNTKITFLNEKTKEYLFYTVAYTTTPADVVKTLRLETPVRRGVTQPLSVENPLAIAASFTTHCDCEDISITPNTFTVAAR